MMVVGVVVCCVVVVCEVVQKIDEALNCLSCPAEGCPTVKWDRNFLVGLGVVHPCRSLERDRKSPNPNSAQGGRYEGERGGARACEPRARGRLGKGGGRRDDERQGIAQETQDPRLSLDAKIPHWRLGCAEHSGTSNLSRSLFFPVHPLALLLLFPFTTSEIPFSIGGVL